MSTLVNLPHDHDIEAAILNCILLKPELIRRCDVDQDIFYSPFHRQIYKAMVELDADGFPPEVVLVRSRILEQTGESKHAEIGRLLDVGALTRHFDGYLNRLKQVAYQRAVVAIEEEISGVAQHPGWKPDEIEEARERKIREARERYWPHEQAMEPIPAEGRLRDFYQRVDDWTTTTGWRSVDEIVGEIHPGSVITVLARPGIGKSVLALNLCANWLRQHGDWGILFASLEMEGTLATDRLIRIIEGWTQPEVMHAMRSGTVPVEYRRLTENRYCLFARARQPLKAIERSIELWQKQHSRRIRAVVVDYFQYLAGQKGESPYEKSSRLSRELKELAKEKEVLIVNLCQVSRGEAGGQGTSCPTLEGARDSGTIEENADVLIGMWRPKPDDPVLMLKALKTRQGMPGGTAELLFSPGNMRLSDSHPRAVK
jgi:replicative DNA helicase